MFTFIGSHARLEGGLRQEHWLRYLLKRAGLALGTIIRSIRAHLALFP
jgi:hypothetical protein